MKKIRVIGKSVPTTDHGLLETGKEYSIGDQLAAYLIKRQFVEIVTAKKKAAKK